MVRVPQVRERGERPADLPDSRIAIRETLDGLGIHNPARRNIVTILILMLWLTGWAFGEVFALSEILRGGNIAGSLFLLVWVTFWTLGGLFAAGVVLWNLFGSERLFVTEGMLVHSVGFGPVRRKRIYPLDEVGDFRVDTRGDPAANAIPLGSIGYRAGGVRHTFGIGMTRAEAEASLAAIRRALPFPDGGDFPSPPAADT